MHIEEVTTNKLSDAPDRELYSLRLRFIQLWNRNFAERDKDTDITVGKLTRSQFLSKYRLLISEMRSRRLKFNASGIDHALFGKRMSVHKLGFDTGALEETTLIPEFISLVGSYVVDPESAEDLDILVRKNTRDESVEIKVSRVLAQQIEKHYHYIYAPAGPHGSYVPLFDLVLKPRSEISKVIVKSDTDKSQSYYSGLDEWSEEFVIEFAALLPYFNKGDKIIDLGCGSGRILRMLKRLGFENLAGIDINEHALELCEKAGLEVKRVDLSKDRLPYDDCIFDVAICTHVLEHVEDVLHLIDEAQRVAKLALFVVPLGKRECQGHKHEYDDISALQEKLGLDQSVVSIEGTNSALIALSLANKLEKASLEPFSRFTPPKPTMASLTEAFKFEDIQNWIKDRWPVDVEEKLNGFRAIIEKSGNKLRIQTEGKQDRTKVLPTLVAILEKIPDDFILDCSLGIVKGDKPLPRIKLMTIMADQPKFAEDEGPQATCFDLPYWEEDLHGKPLAERRKLLEEFYKKYLKSPDFELTSYNQAENKDELEKLFNKLSKLPQSEGVVIKDLNSIWDTSGSTSDWSKIKLELEVKVIVTGVFETKVKGIYRYGSGLLVGDSDYTNIIEVSDQKYIDLGRTFSTALRAKVGDILTVGVEEIIINEKQNELDWLGPRVIDIDEDRATPYSASQVVELASRGPVLQKGGEGSGFFGHAGRPGEVGGSSPGGLSALASGEEWTDDDYVLLQRYTAGGLAEDMILYQRGLPLGPESFPKKEVKEGIKSTEKALAKLPGTKATVYRGLSFDSKQDLEAFVSKIKVGGEFITEAFTSTSKKMEQAEKFGKGKYGVMLEMESFTGRDVSKYSYFPGQKEVLFVQGTRFEVMSKSSKRFKLREVQLETE